MDSKKLLRNLAAGKGSLLIPHIDAYQSRGKFPDEWLIRIPNTKGEDEAFHPSAHCDLSVQALYNEFTKPSKQIIPPSLRRAFDVGHMWHGYLESILQDMGLIDAENVEKKMTVTRDTPMGTITMAGTPDLAGVRIPGHKEWLVDIKTMNKREFEAGAGDRTLSKWKSQINVYGDWLSMDRLMVLAVCKDTPHELREYIIEPDKTLVEQIYNKWAIVQYCLDKGISPDELDTDEVLWYTLPS